MSRLIDLVQNCDLPALRQSLADSATESDDEILFAIRLAVHKNLPEVIDLILEVRPAVSSAPRRGTPLLWAAEANNLLLVKRLLLAPHLIVDAEDEQGMTALLHAAYNQNLEIVQLLVKAGANVRHRNIEGQTALDLARLRRFEVPAGALLGPGHGTHLRLRDTEVGRFLATFLS